MMSLLQESFGDLAKRGLCAACETLSKTAGDNCDTERGVVPFCPRFSVI
jgi:hypothetical protein